MFLVRPACCVLAYRLSVPLHTVCLTVRKSLQARRTVLASLKVMAGPTECPAASRILSFMVRRVGTCWIKPCPVTIVRDVAGVVRATTVFPFFVIIVQNQPQGKLVLKDCWDNLTSSDNAFFAWNTVVPFSAQHAEIIEVCDMLYTAGTPVSSYVTHEYCKFAMQNDNEMEEGHCEWLEPGVPKCWVECFAAVESMLPSSFGANPLDQADECVALAHCTTDSCDYAPSYFESACGGNVEKFQLCVDVMGNQLDETAAQNTIAQYGCFAIPEVR